MFFPCLWRPLGLFTSFGIRLLLLCISHGIWWVDMLSLLTLTLVHEHNTVRFSDVRIRPRENPTCSGKMLDGDGVMNVANVLRHRQVPYR